MTSTETDQVRRANFGNRPAQSAADELVVLAGHLGQLGVRPNYIRIEQSCLIGLGVNLQMSHLDDVTTVANAWDLVPQCDRGGMVYVSGTVDGIAVTVCGPKDR